VGSGYKAIGACQPFLTDWFNNDLAAENGIMFQ
jgi:hypothetical protein